MHVHIEYLPLIDPSPRLEVFPSSRRPLVLWAAIHSSGLFHFLFTTRPTSQNELKLNFKKFIDPHILPLTNISLYVYPHITHLTDIFFSVCMISTLTFLNIKVSLYEHVSKCWPRCCRHAWLRLSWLAGGHATCRGTSASTTPKITWFTQPHNLSLPV